MLVYPLMLGAWEIVTIVFAVVLLFGGKKIPELMRGVGKGIKGFKEGLNGIEEEINNTGTSKSDNKKVSTSDKEVKSDTK